VLRQRARALPVVSGKHACHSEVTPDADEAKNIQGAILGPA
jgi:hypothetical protein